MADPFQKPLHILAEQLKVCAAQLRLEEPVDAVFARMGRPRLHVAASLEALAQEAMSAKVTTTACEARVSAFRKALEEVSEQAWTPIAALKLALKLAKAPPLPHRLQRLDMPRELLAMEGHVGLVKAPPGSALDAPKEAALAALCRVRQAREAWEAEEAAERVCFAQEKQTSAKCRAALREVRDIWAQALREGVGAPALDLSVVARWRR